MAERIYQQNIKDRFTYDMQVYAIALNRKQAVPSAIDGLKVSYRRVIDAMFFKGRLTHDKPYSKCAGVIGDTLKYYHPHGDSSVYGVLCQLATWWDSKIPLIDGQTL